MNKCRSTTSWNILFFCRLSMIITHSYGICLVWKYFIRFSNGCEVLSLSNIRNNLTSTTDSGINFSLGSICYNRQNLDINWK